MSVLLYCSSWFNCVISSKDAKVKGEICLTDPNYCVIIGSSKLYKITKVFEFERREIYV